MCAAGSRHVQATAAQGTDGRVTAALGTDGRAMGVPGTVDPALAVVWVSQPADHCRRQTEATASVLYDRRLVRTRAVLAQSIWPAAIWLEARSHVSGYVEERFMYVLSCVHCTGSLSVHQCTSWRTWMEERCIISLSLVPYAEQYRFLGERESLPSAFVSLY